MKTNSSCFLFFLLLFFVSFNLALIKTSTINYITSCDDLSRIIDLSGTYILRQDIDCSKISTRQIGNSITPFHGVFDGQGHKISNINITITLNILDNNYAGLFPIIYDAEIRDLILEDPIMPLPNNSSYLFNGIAFIAGYSYYSRIINCSVRSTDTIHGIEIRSINSPHLAIISGGTFHNSSIINCTVENVVAISEQQQVGSITANLEQDSLVSGCVNRGFTLNPSKVVVQGTSRAGGLVGNISGGKIEKSMMINGRIIATKYSGSAGGICGTMDFSNSRIDQVFVNSTVIIEAIGNSSSTGGIVGSISNNELDSAFISNSQSHATVTGAFSGSIIGSVQLSNDSKSMLFVVDSFTVAKSIHSILYGGLIIGKVTAGDKQKLLLRNIMVNNSQSTQSTIVGLGNISDSSNVFEIHQTTTARLYATKLFNQLIWNCYSLQLVESTFNNQCITNCRSTTNCSFLDSTYTTNFCNPQFNICVASTIITNISPFKPHVQNITNCNQLQEINSNLEASYKLVNDIDCSAISFSPIGHNGAPFRGVLDGQNYKIKNLSFKKDSNSNALFGYIVQGQVKNVIIENINSSSKQMAAGIAVLITHSIIDHCYLTSTTIQGNLIQGSIIFGGGIVSWSLGSRITNCKVDRTLVIGGFQVGGVVGLAHFGSVIDNCTNDGFIDSFSQTIVSGGYHAGGGVVGVALFAQITNCKTSNGKIKTLNAAGGVIGLAGGVSIMAGLEATNSVSVTNIPFPLFPGISGGVIGVNVLEPTPSNITISKSTSRSIVQGNINGQLIGQLHFLYGGSVQIIDTLIDTTNTQTLHLLVGNIFLFRFGQDTSNFQVLVKNTKIITDQLKNNSLIFMTSSSTISSEIDLTFDSPKILEQFQQGNNITFNLLQCQSCEFNQKALQLSIINPDNCLQVDTITESSISSLVAILVPRYSCNTVKWYYYTAPVSGVIVVVIVSIVIYLISKKQSIKKFQDRLKRIEQEEEKEQL